MFNKLKNWGRIEYTAPKVTPKVTPKPWTPQKGIPDQSKLKNIGVGWGGERLAAKKKKKK